jgi:hypothetical protein
MHHRKHMSHDHYPLLCDDTAVTDIAACWTVFTELLRGNALQYVLPKRRAVSETIVSVVRTSDAADS